MLSQDQVQQVVGAEAYGSDGEKIGKVGQIFLDDQTGEPVFATVNTGLFGMNENFVPMTNASISQGRLDVGFDKELVKGAPNVSPDDGHLSPEEEQALYDYYGIAYSGGETYPESTGGVDETTYSTTDTERSGYGAEQSDRTDDSMTRSEEQVRIGKTREVTGRARLRKYVVTENVTITVPVRREKAVLESVPIGEGDFDDDSGDIVEGAALEGSPEILLSEEVPVVETVVRPVERVRLGTEQYVENETVTEEVRKERIEVQGDVIEPGEGTDTDR